MIYKPIKTASKRMKYKIIFPTEYDIDNYQNDNIDVNIILENNDVFFATLFTLKNIIYLMEKESINYFSADNMVIVKNLSKDNINKIVSEVIKRDELNSTFSKIGTIKEVFDTDKSFTELYDNLKII